MWRGVSRATSFSDAPRARRMCAGVPARRGLLQHFLHDAEGSARKYSHAEHPKLAAADGFRATDAQHRVGSGSDGGESRNLFLRGR